MLLYVYDTQEAEQKRLELEMQKRRERIEQWRAARKAKQEDATAGDETRPAAASRKWTLEDEEDEDAENDVTAAQNGEAEDVDPLDAYMQVYVLCAGTSCVQVCLICRHVLCAGMSCVQVCLVCRYVLCAGTSCLQVCRVQVCLVLCAGTYCVQVCLV